MAKDTRLDQIVRIADEAGKIILTYYGKDSQVREKEGGSPLTLADTQASKHIVESLKALDSSIPVISEEEELPTLQSRSHWRRFWLVDPLDGTKEFLDKADDFTVNIALIENGEPVLGVVLAPAKDVSYFAQAGQGSWRRKNGSIERIYSNEPDKSGALTVAVSRRHATSEIEQVKKTRTIDKLVEAGSSLKFCLVAEGTVDVYPRMGPTMEWDVAAGDCVYRNSARTGQRTTSLRYNKADLKNGPFVVGLSEDWSQRQK